MLSHFNFIVIRVNFFFVLFFLGGGGQWRRWVLIQDYAHLNHHAPPTYKLLLGLNLAQHYLIIYCLMVRPIPCTWVDFQKVLRFNIMLDKDCRSLSRLVASFLPCIVQLDGLISDQLWYSLNIYQFDYSVLCFLIKNSSNKRTKSTSCFIFLFEISKNKKNEINEKILKKAMVGI